MARILLPPADEETLAEVNLTLTSRRSRAKGVVFPSVCVSEAQVDAVLSQCVPVAALVPGTRPAWGSPSGGAAASSSGGASSTLTGMLTSLSRLLQSKLGVPLPWPLQPPRPRSQLPPPALLAWHAQRQWLAVGHAPADAVLVYNLDAAPSDPSAPERVEEAQLVLVHELQQGVAALAWRPVHCTMLAAGGRGGVTLWSLGRQPAGGGGFQRAAAGAGGNGGGVGGQAWASFLRYADNCR